MWSTRSARYSDREVGGVGVTKTRTGLGLDWAWTGQYTVLYTPVRVW